MIVAAATRLQLLASQKRVQRKAAGEPVRAGLPPSNPITIAEGIAAYSPTSWAHTTHKTGERIVLVKLPSSMSHH
eukprot:1697788-Amphidinium_carterae.1